MGNLERVIVRGEREAWSMLDHSGTERRKEVPAGVHCAFQVIGLDESEEKSCLGLK